MPTRIERTGGLKIGNKKLSNDRTYVIAEVGSNHAGNLDVAIHHIDAAAEAGADGVKFQLFKWADVTHLDKKQDPRYELPPQWIPTLRQRATAHGLGFICTPFAPWAVEVLDSFVDAWKIGSFEALHYDLLRAIPKDLRPWLISTGMLDEPWLEDDNSQREVLLHCVSLYPTPYFEANIRAITRLRGLRGYSSHTPGFADVWAAKALGICVVEKHIQAEGAEGPDAGPWALTPMTFREMVRGIRQIEDSLLEGSGVPEPPFGRKLHGK